MHVNYRMNNINNIFILWGQAGTKPGCRNFLSKQYKRRATGRHKSGELSGRGSAQKKKCNLVSALQNHLKSTYVMKWSSRRTAHLFAQRWFNSFPRARVGAVWLSIYVIRLLIKKTKWQSITKLPYKTQILIWEYDLFVPDFFFFFLLELHLFSRNENLL